ncbi:protein phosphatase 2C domain-containing protein [Frankia sp. AgB32]|uniref:protein phosphatase 2C domain-containing protein n=1 Tax=Frankia sp. AgB32 TaxID=631119 RepID=UPI00200FCAC2|nr:protein phosphatase 2C domain-containing protein [Frankia sp. AgB32]MCK9897231.1 protein phosphatase 2C domain-containing protein [Frankia sp. AgB32]
MTAAPTGPARAGEAARPADPAVAARPARPLPAAPPTCPSCGADALPVDRFCEACGTALHRGAVPALPVEVAPPAPEQEPEQCAECRGVELDADGYCLTCGLRRARPEPDPDTRTELDLGPVAGVSDRGLVHRANEDAMAAAVISAAGESEGTVRADPPPGGSHASGAAMAAVVCDGVSRAAGSGPGARTAVAAALNSLRAAAPAVLAAPEVDPGGRNGAGAGGLAGDALRAAAAAGQAAIVAVPVAPGDEPSCTFAAALYAAGELTVGWLGDSRIYLFDQAGARLLSADDTVAAQAARDGLIPPEVAETAPGAHTITSWLGRRSPRTTPHVRTARPAGPGRVVVCTDGLWNGVSAPGAMSALVAELPADVGAAEVARHLVAAALRAGGRDNITVVVIDIPGSA